jgi:MerR family transcriptional regulator, copper efflux regulator
MNIGQAANATGVSAKMIRYYESIGLIRESARTDSGYRIYCDSELHTLRFIKRARKLGFSIDQIRMLLSLWQDPSRASKDVKTVAIGHVEDLNKRIQEMTEMRDTLEYLAKHCAGDHRPDCPILAGLAETTHAPNGHCAH